MVEKQKTPKKEAEEDLSMDEILSSIRSIITEEKDVDKVSKRIFAEDSSTNPSGARVMEDIPTFENNDSFDLPNFYEEDFNKQDKIDHKQFAKKEVFPDEDFERNRENERAFAQESESYYSQPKYFREVGGNSEDRLSSALKTIVDSYATRKIKENNREEEFLDHTKMTHAIDSVIEKIIVSRVEAWLQENLSEIIEKTIVRELERVALNLKI